MEVGGSVLAFVVQAVGAVTLLLLACVLVYHVLDRLLRLPLLPVDSRCIVITGCDSGFGEAAAVHLDALGCRVFAACFSERGETSLRKRCSSRLTTLQLDVSRPESVRRAFELVTTSLGSRQGLWGLINNAGIGSSAYGPLEWMTVANFRECMEVNCLGVVDVTLTFLPLLKRARGRVVITTSALVRGACAPTHGPYTASKFASEGFADVLRRTVRWYGVSVHIVEPGPFPTSMGDRALKQAQISRAWDQASPQLQQDFGGPDYLQKLREYAVDARASIEPYSLDAVIHAYTHALLARLPRARYAVGSGLRAVLLIEALPEWISDRIQARLCHMPLPQSVGGKG